MRPLPPPLLCLIASVLLTGCQSFYAASGVFAGISVATLTTMGRSAPDAVVSLIRDRDCSVVRLEQGLSYCVPPDPPPQRAEFCTHSLGTPDCWAHPDRLPGTPIALADTPNQTAEQIIHGAHRWPDEWSPK